MSDALIVRRGGSGGLSTNSAVIHVSGDAGSTITFAKGGVIVKTLGPEKQHLNAGDNTRADWYFSVSPANYGTWTVAETRGSDIASASVTVDSNKQHDVRLEYSLYIIRDGTVNPDVVHTFSSAKGSLTDGAAYATYCSGEGSGNNDGYVMFTIPDVTRYSTLVMELYEAKGWGGSGKNPQFGIYDTTPNSTSNPTNALAYVQIYGPNASDSGYTVSERDFTLDISSYAGPKYIVIQNAAAYTTTLRDNHWYIKNFYLALGVTS